MFSSQIPSYSARRHISLTLFLYFINIYTSDSVRFHIINFVESIGPPILMCDVDEHLKSHPLYSKFALS